jgi:hypothetical protein
MRMHLLLSPVGTRAKTLVPTHTGKRRKDAVIQSPGASHLAVKKRALGVLEQHAALRRSLQRRPVYWSVGSGYDNEAADPAVRFATVEAQRIGCMKLYHKGRIAYLSALRNALMLQRKHAQRSQSHPLGVTLVFKRYLESKPCQVLLKVCLALQTRYPRDKVNASRRITQSQSLPSRVLPISSPSRSKGEARKMSTPPATFSSDESSANIMSSVLGLA